MKSSIQQKQSRKLVRLTILAASVSAIVLTFAGAAVSQRERVLYSFVPRTGSGPNGLISDGAGNLYGTTVYSESGHGVVFELSPASGGGWTEAILYTFIRINLGWNPGAGLVRDGAGNLYGTTVMGGETTTSCIEGCGVVFELSPISGGWQESVLHTFKSATDGSYPLGGLVMDAGGNLYGSTQFGGNIAECGGAGCGVAFKLSSQSSGEWHDTILHTFTGGRDGANPIGSLILDAAGKLYGVTEHGGYAKYCVTTNYNGCGVAYELSTTTNGGWAQTVLWMFDGGNQGGIPMSGLTTNSTGDLFGTTSQGGNPKCLTVGCGVIFELSHSSGTWQESLVKVFNSGNDGGVPLASVLLDSDGNIYGTSSQGGNTKSVCGPQGCGMVFELSPVFGGWRQTVLHVFTGQGDGVSPNSGLIFDPVGNLYGTTSFGGVAGTGTAFEVTP